MSSSRLEALEQGLGHKFTQRELITEALTHRSHHHEFGDSSHNERLEFLGDAVIDLCVTEALMKLSPDTDEGELSKLRSQLVSEASLAQVARNLHLGEAIRLGRGEDRSGGRNRDSLLADTFEAVMAAVYLDAGLKAAQDVVLRLLEVTPKAEGAMPWKKTTERLLSQDFKSRLQEICQSFSLGAPAYRCIETRGPDHKKRFVMGMFLRENEVIRAEASTKKEATQLAARMVLEKIEADPQALRAELHRMAGLPDPSLNRKKKGAKAPAKEESPAL